jgi:hypothetical protein
MSAATIDPAEHLPAPQPHRDEELRAALAPFVADYLAHLKQNRAALGRDGANMLTAARLSRYYSLICVTCMAAAEEWQKGGTP